MKLDRKLESALSEIKNEAQTVFKSVMTYVNKHKKIIVLGIGLYVIYKYLFQEDEV